MTKVDIEKSEQTAFETFAKLHPVEAYDSDKDRFCNYFRIQNPDASNNQIKILIDKQRKS